MIVNNKEDPISKINEETIRYLSKLIYDDKMSYLDEELNEVLGSMFNE